MLTEYIDESLRRAKYEIIDDEEPFYGEVKELKGVWATGKTLEQCRDNLKEVVEGWILISLKKDLPIPKRSTITPDFTFHRAVCRDLFRNLSDLPMDYADATIVSCRVIN